MTVLLAGPMRVVLLGRFRLCSAVSDRSVNVLPSLTRLTRLTATLVWVRIPPVVGVGLTFTTCGLMLVVVTVMMCVPGARFRVVVVLVDRIVSVVVLLPMFEVPLVAIDRLGLPMFPSSVSTLIAALGCGRLLALKMTGLFPPRGTAIGMTLLWNRFVVRVVV